jgi:hypothetical protein
VICARVLIAIVAALVMNRTSMAAVGESSFEFMLIGTGARGAAMAEAFTAVSGDVGAPVFNPASAGKMMGTELSLSHISYIQDVRIEQFSAMTRSRDFRYGISLNVGSVSDLERRDDYPSEEPLGLFDQHNVTFSFFWAVPLSDRLAIGNAAKFAYEKLDLDEASAIALDLGLFYTITPQLALGGSVRNLGTRPKFVEESFELPREYRLGASYRTPEESRYKGLVLSADYLKPEWGNQSSKLNIGGEYNYDNLLFFRLGYHFGYDSRSITVGGGISYRIYMFDYAYVPIKNNLGNSHRFTLRIRL